MDILCFLKSAWSVIAIFGFIGILLSVTFLPIAPNQYIARSQITMAQIGTASDNSNNISPLGVNIEDPSLLIARLSWPTSFTPQVITACGFENQASAALTLISQLNYLFLTALQMWFR